MNVVILTGAGISQESGIPTFRAAGGLWEGIPVDQVATPEGFAANPDIVFDFYNQRRRKLLDPAIRPNAAHRALAEFERQLDPGQFLLITQNIDNLHERAGSENVLHMHGELLKVRCLDTGEVFHWTDDLDANSLHPRDPNRVGRLRPHIVWFGEIPLEMDRAVAALECADLFVAIGTSGVVYPAAGFVTMTPPSCRRVEINMDDTPVGSMFDQTIRGTAGEAVPEFLNGLL